MITNHSALYKVKNVLMYFDWRNLEQKMAENVWKNIPSVLNLDFYPCADNICKNHTNIDFCTLMQANAQQRNVDKLNKIINLKHCCGYYSIIL